MTIIKNIDEYQFRAAFQDYGRADQFSYEGLSALFSWLDELSDDTGEPMELDVIALCCDFTEYENLAELQQNYPDIESIDDLNDNTFVIPVNDEAFIIQDY